ncbi:glutamate ABC transporter substrate-binding protein [Nocardia sp. NPDC005978]|uniref:glutamate ABC transporter substrate-binding protein n=1 Tax=Nocardia sp. NPDC005978 TaxID=3156725 RepID=UPI0033A2AF84
MKRVFYTGSIATVLVLTACALQAAPKPEAPQPPARTLTIGIAEDQPGLSTRGPDGRPRGFDVDTAVYIAGRLGVDPEHITWREARPEQREALLNNGSVDFIAASYSITAARQQQVSFAGPYLIAGQDLLVRHNERHIDRPEDLHDRAICTTAGSTAADHIRRSFARTVELTTRDTYSECAADLISGVVDAVTADDVILAGFAKKYDGTLRVVGHQFTRERYGIGVRKGDIALQARITDAIRTMIDDGSWRRAMETHLTANGFRPQAAPVVFNAPDRPVPPADPATLDPDLVRVTNAVAATSNAHDWEGFRTLVCPETANDIDEIVTHYTPRYDTHLGPELTTAGFTHTVTAVTQPDPDTATFVLNEKFTDVPDKYRNYFKDINYTGTLIRREGSWKLCTLNADFVEP